MTATYEPIEYIELSSNTNTITFSGISGYQKLILVGDTVPSGDPLDIQITFNNSTIGYNWRYFYTEPFFFGGDYFGPIDKSQAGSSQSNIPLGSNHTFHLNMMYADDANTDTGYSGMAFEYDSTLSDGFMRVISGHSAQGVISSIQINNVAGNTAFANGSTFGLYGIVKE